MKWPERLTLVRHAESAYNKQKALKQESDLYQKFKKAYDENPLSPDCKEIAIEVKKTFPVLVGDHNTPLAKDDNEKSTLVGKALRDKIAIPEVIFVSPYERTHETLKGIIKGWPQLAEVKTVEEERLREQEHGLSLLYWDWRLFNVMNPEQIEFRKIEGEYYYRYPQGENIPDVRERIRSWLGTLVRDYSEKKVMNITHHLSILSIRADLERLSADEFIRLDKEEKPINLGVTLYKGDPNQGTDGKLILEAYNVKLY